MDLEVVPATYSRRTYSLLLALEGIQLTFRRRRAEVQSHQHPVRVREIADDFFHRRWQISHQGWDGHDLITASQLGILQEIDQLNAVSVRQMLRANPLEIREGGNRFWRLSRDIKPQYPSIVLRLGMRLGMLSYFRAGQFCSLFGLLAGCWTWHRPDG